MPLTGGAEAHDEAQTACGHAGLIRMRHDGGIEERSGLQRVFTAEKSADEELPRAGERALREDFRLHFRKVAHEHRLDVKVAAVEVRMHAGELFFHLRLRQCQRTADDGGKASGAGGNEGPDDHAGALRLEDDLMAVDGEVTHARAGRGCCAKVISARARWKASVDSAPWFSFTRSGCSPSPQPPVMGS